MTRLATHTAEPPIDTGSSAAAVLVEGVTHRYPTSRPRRRDRNRPENRRSTPSDTTPPPALDNVSLSIRPREIFGILGPNGGGKTTLFKILSTMLRPTAGRVEVFGHDVVRESNLVRQQLGVVFQMPSLDAKLTAEENLMHQGHLYGLSGSELRSRMADALAAVNLADRRGERTERFSGGMRRRVELAKALLHQPRLLLLDEPATGLDPGARRDVWNQLEQLRGRGVTVALTTHLMEEADRCDRLAILSRGKLVAIDTPGNLKSRIGGDVVTIEAETSGGSSGGAPAELAELIGQRFGPWSDGAGPTVVDGKIRIEIANGPAFVATVASAFPGKVRSITVGRPTLEDVFLDLTGQKLWDESEASVASSR